MTWEEKLQSLNEIAQCRLMMRKPGDWYVSQSVEVKDGGICRSAYGNGVGPIEAVLNHWQNLTDLESGLYVVTISVPRLAFRWNGTRWVRVQESPYRSRTK